MRLFLSPQEITDPKDRILYKFNNQSMECTIDGITEVFNFEGLPDGKLDFYNKNTGENNFYTELPFNPIVSAEKKDGVLYLEIINRIGENASEEEKFPVWVDASSYVQPEIKNVVSEKEELVKKDELEGWDDF